MITDHETLVAIAKSWGLFYLIGMSVCVLLYALWPGNRQRFEKAKMCVLEKDDRPWR